MPMLNAFGNLDHQIKESARLEVAHSDGKHLALAISLFHRPPSAKHIAVGLMDEQQVINNCILSYFIEKLSASYRNFGDFFISILMN